MKSLRSWKSTPLAQDVDELSSEASRPAIFLTSKSTKIDLNRSSQPEAAKSREHLPFVPFNVQLHEDGVANVHLALEPIRGALHAHNRFLWTVATRWPFVKRGSHGPL